MLYNPLLLIKSKTDRVANYDTEPELLQPFGKKYNSGELKKVDSLYVTFMFY